MKFAFILILVLAATVRSQLPNEIVFTGQDRVYVIRADGTGQTPITSPAAGSRRPRWSRDGRRIVFSKGNVCLPDYSSRIWKMNADGSNQTLFEPNWYIPSLPVFSRYAERIAFVGTDCFNGGENVSVANTDGSNPADVTELAGFINGLDWSPVEERLVYSRAYGSSNWITSVNADGTNSLDLTTHGQGNNFDPVWSPDGSKIAFVSGRDGNSEIYTMNANGSNQVRVTYSPSDDRDPTWSPDGTRLAFSSNRNGPFNIFVASVDGTNPIQITNNAFNSLSPNWNLSVAPYQPAFDFDGDGRSDISVFRPSDSTWYVNRSSDGFTGVQFGISADEIVPADYDGDGKTDVAIFRDGMWWLMKSSNNSVEVIPFGMAADVPVPSDYTGDGRDELAVYRNGQWWALDLSSDQSSLINFGLGSDQPVAADYDGDAKVDIAVFRPSDGSWWINRSTGGVAVVTFGNSGDTPLPGDYTGDGKADVALFRPADGNWYVLRSEDASYYAFPWGLSTDIPAPADYDGDGKFDATVFREGTWYINRTTGGFLITAFGLPGDRPIPNAYVP